MTKWITPAVFFAAGAIVLFTLRDAPDVPVEDPLGPFGLPRAIAVGLVLVAAGLAAQAWWGAARAPAEDEPPVDPRSRLLGALTMVATVAYVLILPVLGFVIASIVFGVGLLPVLGARRLWTVLAVPAAVVAVLWLLFVYTLDVELPSFLT